MRVLTFFSKSINPSNVEMDTILDEDEDGGNGGGDGGGGGSGGG